MHIRISLSTKFQLKLTILSFGIKFTQKGYNRTKQKSNKPQALAFCVVNINSTIVFEHFGDLKNLIIFNILKEKLVNSCFLGSFYLNRIHVTATNIGISPLPSPRTF